MSILHIKKISCYQIGILLTIIFATSFIGCGGSTTTAPKNSSPGSSTSSSKSSTPKVEDNSPPTITITGGYASGDTITIEAGQPFSAPTITATDNVDTDLTLNNNIDSLDFSVVGTYTITYTATDSSDNQATATININVVLEIPGKPTIAFVDYIEGGKVTITLGNLIPYPQTIVSDDNDFFLTATHNGDTFDLTQPGTYNIIYSVTDSSDKLGTATFTLEIVLDTVDPVISFNDGFADGDTINLPIGSEDPFPTAIATDNIDTTVPIVNNSAEVVDVNTVGVYTITYTATDSSGNMATLTLLIKVISDLTAEVKNSTNFLTSIDTIYLDFSVTNLSAASENILIKKGSTIKQTISATDNSKVTIMNSRVKIKISPLAITGEYSLLIPQGAFFSGGLELTPNTVDGLSVEINLFVKDLSSTLINGNNIGSSQFNPSGCLATTIVDNVTNSQCPVYQRQPNNGEIGKVFFGVTSSSALYVNNLKLHGGHSTVANNGLRFHYDVEVYNVDTGAWEVVLDINTDTELPNNEQPAIAINKYINAWRFICRGRSSGFGDPLYLREFNISN